MALYRLLLYSSQRSGIARLLIPNLQGQQIPAWLSFPSLLPLRYAHWPRVANAQQWNIPH